MKNKDENWHNSEVKKLKKEKQEALGSHNDMEGTAQEVLTRKRITEDFKRKRRSIKRSEKQNLKKFIDDEIISNF